MDERLDKLKQLIKRKRKLSLSNLKAALIISNDDVLMTQILDLIERELVRYNFNREPSRNSFLFSCFDYLEYSKSRIEFSDEATSYVILKRLKEISDTIEYKLENPGTITKYYKYLSNQEILIKVQDRINNLKTNYDDEETVVKEDAIYKVIHHLIFDVQNLNFVKELFTEMPAYKNIRNETGKTILQEAIETFLKLAKENADIYQINYFEKIIRLYSRTYSNKQVLNQIKRHVLHVEKEILFNESLTPIIKNRLAYHLSQIATSFKIEPKENIPYKRTTINKTMHDMEFSTSNDNEEINQYIDMLDRYVITIDTPQCLFKEDAFSLEILPNGNYQLGIYIVDVDYFAKEGSVLDLMAKRNTIAVDEKSTTLFPIEFLRKNVSLNKGSNRPVIAYTFVFDDHAKIISSDITKAIISVSNNYNYKTVKNEITDEKNDIISNCFNLINTRQKRIKNHNIDYLLSENKKSLKMNQASIGEVIISSLSVFLNSYIGSHFSKNNLPFIYRIDHFVEGDNLVHYVKDLLGKCKETKNLTKIIKNVTVPTSVSPNNYGYHCLDVKAYGCVTNPGRMYDALINQRLIKKYMIDKKLGDFNQYEEDQKLINDMCKYINEKNENITFFREENNRQKTLTKSL